MSHTDSASKRGSASRCCDCFRSVFMSVCVHILEALPHRCLDHKLCTYLGCLPHTSQDATFVQIWRTAGMGYLLWCPAQTSLHHSVLPSSQQAQAGRQFRL